MLLKRTHVSFSSSMSTYIVKGLCGSTANMNIAAPQLFRDASLKENAGASQVSPPSVLLNNRPSTLGLILTDAYKVRDVCGSIAKAPIPKFGGSPALNQLAPPSELFR